MCVTSDTLQDVCRDEVLSIDKILFDQRINDLDVMRACGYSVCPSDSHPMVKDIADQVLSQKGGDAVARELVEKILEIDIYETLYSKNDA